MSVTLRHSSVFTPTASAQTVSPTGIASGEAFGTPQVNQNIAAIGIASAEAFGTAQFNQNITAAGGIASGEAFGTPVVTQGPVTISPTGIPSGEAFGTATFNQNVIASGIPSAEAFGTLSVQLSISPVGIGSAEAFGTPTVVPGAATITLQGIASAEAFGTPTITKTPIWRLVSPFVDEKFERESKLSVLHRTGITVYGNDDGLVAKRSPSTHELEGKKYIFYGGYEYIIDDPALVDLWVNSGFEVVSL